MIALIIVFAIIILLSLFLLTWVRLSFVYNESETALILRVLGFKYIIFDKNPKRIKKSRFKIKRFRRRCKKILKKRKKALAKKKKSPKDKEFITEDTETKKSTPKELVNRIIKIFGVFIKRFPRFLKIDCARLIIGVGGRDAAETAITYGATVQSVQYLVTMLGNVTSFKAEKNSQISVYPDFVSEKWSADIKITMRLRVIHIIKLAFIVLKSYLSQKTKRNKKREPNDIKKAA